jgi:proteasome assembly chaperone (PAC2) family protein
MRIFNNITFETPPTLLAAWPGMGNVGLIAMDYLRRTLKAEPFAEIDMTPFFVPDSIVVKDGVAQFPNIPSSVFHYTLRPSLIIFESNAQVGGQEGLTIIKTILDLVKQFGVKRVYTAAAFAQSMSFQANSEVLVACTAQELLGTLRAMGITPMPDGIIAGLNGLMLGVANARSIESACLLGTIPAYAANLAYPKASLEIIRTLARMLGAAIDTAELEASVQEMDRQFAQIEERIRQFFPTVEEHDEEIKELDEEKVPHYIMEKIEELFQAVEKDHARAAELKKELDRWNIYELYENRFLDIFDDDKKPPAHPL